MIESYSLPHFANSIIKMDWSEDEKLIEALQQKVKDLQSTVTSQSCLLAQYRQLAKATLAVPTQIIDTFTLDPPSIIPPRPKRKMTPSESLHIKQRRLTELIDQFRIKYPLKSDEHDFPESETARLFWHAIVECFAKLPGGILTDQMILAHMNSKDMKTLHRYFNHNFTMTDQEEYMTVRPYGTHGWLVLLPPWLHEKILL